MMKKNKQTLILERRTLMNDRLFRTLLKRYEAEIEDALYKLQCIEDHNMVIPEHVDITGEVDTLLGKIGKAEEKLSVMRKYYGKKETKTAL